MNYSECAATESPRVFVAFIAVHYEEIIKPVFNIELKALCRSTLFTASLVSFGGRVALLGVVTGYFDRHVALINFAPRCTP